MSFASTFLLIALPAFVFGFALQRGQVCSVLAARQLVETGRSSRLAGFVYAALFAFAASYPLAVVMPDVFQLTSGYPPSLMAVAAGAAYGTGAFVNGACIFGICSRAVSGSIHFMAAVPGLALGAVVAMAAGAPALLGPQGPSLLVAAPYGSALLMVVAVTGAALVAIRTVETHRRAGVGLGTLMTAARWRSSLALMVLGVTGGLLFATQQEWGYATLVRQTGTWLAGMGKAPSPAALAGTAALLAGATVSMWLGGRFVFKRPRWAHVARSFLGGTIMGASAAFVPGGNDVMILYTVPGLAMQALLAYAAMMATLIGLALIVNRRRAGRGRGGAMVGPAGLEPTTRRL